jgi:hypothetical protein
MIAPCEIRASTTAALPDDRILQIIERIEKRVVACSYLVAKTVSVLVFLAALLLLEAGVLKHLWSAEFAPRGW